jgi:hypothetical protein
MIVYVLFVHKNLFQREKFELFISIKNKNLKNLKKKKIIFIGFFWVGFLGGILLATLPAPSRGGSCGAELGPASALAVPTGCPVQWDGIFENKSTISHVGTWWCPQGLQKLIHYPIYDPDSAPDPETQKQLLRIRDVYPGFEFFHPGSRVKTIPDPHQRILSILSSKIFSKHSEI